MTFGLNEGTTGAKRATWRSVNPRELMRKIIDEHPPGAEGPTAQDEQQWRQLFWEEVQESRLHLRAAIEWFAQAAINAIVEAKSRRSDQQVARQSEREAATTQAAQAIKQTIREHIEKEAQILLLDLLMPNGKTLARCTGAECRTFGGWLAKIANKVPAKKLVGDVLNETEVRKLWRAE
jgi:hypothetical protein